MSATWAWVRSWTSKPTRAALPSTPAFIRMHGQRVFKFATAAIVEAARAVCERAGVSMDEVSCIVPHQANDRIIRFAAKKLGVPYERWQVSIAEAGNTSASSVLMALSDAYEEGRIKPGDQGDVRGLWRRPDEWRAAVRGIET